MGDCREAPEDSKTTALKDEWDCLAPELQDGVSPEHDSFIREDTCVEPYRPLGRPNAARPQTAGYTRSDNGQGVCRASQLPGSQGRPQSAGGRLHGGSAWSPGLQARDEPYKRLAEHNLGWQPGCNVGGVPGNQNITDDDEGDRADELRARIRSIAKR